MLILKWSHEIRLALSFNLDISPRTLRMGKILVRVIKQYKEIKQFRVLKVISVSDCATQPSSWKNVVTDPGLPVRHGIVISLSCDKDFSNKGGDKATCHDGKLKIEETASPPDCRGETKSID